MAWDRSRGSLRGRVSRQKVGVQLEAEGRFGSHLLMQGAVGGKAERDTRKDRREGVIQSGVASSAQSVQESGQRDCAQLICFSRLIY